MYYSRTLCVVCLQSFIKNYGIKRLAEIADHKRKKNEERLKRRQENNKSDSNKNSPVHRMLDQSAGLFARVVQIGHLGRRASRSVDNLVTTKVDYTQELESDANNGLDTCDLLKRVIALGRQEVRSHSHLDRIKDNNLEPFIFINQDPDLVPDKKLNIPVENSTTTGSRGKWTSLLGKKDVKVPVRKMTNHQGRQYEAVSTDDNESENDDTQRLPPATSEAGSPEHVAVVVETEESDLDNTTATPDEPLEDPGPDVVQFSHRPPSYKYPSLSASSSTSSSLGAAGTLQKGSDLLISAWPGSADDWTTVRDTITHINETRKLSVPDKLPLKPHMRHQKNKSVSFDNPSYLNICEGGDGIRLRKARSDNSLERPSTLPVTGEQLNRDLQIQHTRLSSYHLLVCSSMFARHVQYVGTVFLGVITVFILLN